MGRADVDASGVMAVDVMSVFSVLGAVVVAAYLVVAGEQEELSAPVATVVVR
jgi:hypothetical protein